MSEQQIDQYVKAVLKRVSEIDDIPALIANVYRKQVIIQPKHVVYIEKYKKSTRIHLKQSAYDLYGIQPDEDGIYPDIRLGETLDTTYERLRKYGFGRPHGSYIVNFAYLSYSTGSEVRMIEIPNSFPIARSWTKNFNKERERFLTKKYTKEE